MICYISIVNAREGNIEIEKVVLACKILNKKKLICKIILLYLYIYIVVLIKKKANNFLNDYCAHNRVQSI